MEEIEENSKTIKKNVIIINIVAAIFIIVFCFAITPVTFQNDTFYTIKLGEVISEQGIDFLDPFSWHENLEYLYPHWLFDLGIYLVYNAFGNVGIYVTTCILASILGLSIYYCNYKLNNKNILSFFLTLLIMYLMMGFITARAQIVTFSCFVFTWYFIQRFLEKPKVIYGILLFATGVFIANIHVAVWPFFFVLFLPPIGEQFIIFFVRDKIIGSKSDIKAYKKDIKKLKKSNPDDKKIAEYEEKIIELEEKHKKRMILREEKLKTPYKVTQTRNKNIKWLVVIMLLCILSGLITPLGPTTSYTYLIKTLIGDTTQYISEHQPTVLISNGAALVFLILFIGLLTFTKAKVSLTDLFLVGGLTLLALLTTRQVSMLLILGSFVLLKLVDQLFDVRDYSNILINTTMKKPASLLVIFIYMILIVSPCITDNLNSDFIDETSYPVEATKYIKENLDVENIRLFNEYNYGSYLLFNDIPVFIDSRCDLYTPQYNEGCTVFDDVMKTLSAEIYCEEIFEKYEITHIIVAKDATIYLEISGADNGKYNMLYEDDYFAVYEYLPYSQSI